MKDHTIYTAAVHLQEPQHQNKPIAKKKEKKSAAKLKTTRICSPPISQTPYTTCQNKHSASEVCFERDPLECM